MRRRIALLALLVLAGCTTRDPLNPLDPENPDTGGNPRWLEARADRDAVDLLWDVPAFLDLEAVQVRDTVRDTVLAVVPAGSDTLRHAPLPDGVDARYRLELVLAGGRVDPLGEVTATPGPAVPWVVDESSLALWRVAPDGRERRAFVRVRDVSGLEVDPTTGTVLVLEFFARRVRTVDAEGNPGWSDDTGSRGPFAAARVAGGWWVADPSTPAMLRYTDTGQVAVRDTTYRLPLDVSVDAAGRVWVADGPGGARRTGGGDPELRVPVPCDRVIALPDGGAWLYDSGLDVLRRVDAAGNELVSLTVPGVTAVAADPLTPVGLWLLEEPGDAVLRDGAGREILRRPEPVVPADLAVSADGSVLWIADRSEGLLRVARDGSEVRRTRGINAGSWVALADDPVGAAPGPPGGLPR